MRVDANAVSRGWARADDFMPSVMTCANYLKLPE